MPGALVPESFVHVQVANVVLKTPQRRFEESGDSSAARPGAGQGAARAAAVDPKRSTAHAAARARPSIGSMADRAAPKSRAFQ